MSIVICAHARRIGLFWHAKFSGRQNVLLFAMGRVDFAGEFSARGRKNNGRAACHRYG
jgi:hypothetical protein